MKKRFLFLGSLVLLILVYILLIINNGLEDYYLLLQLIFLAPLIVAILVGFLVVKEYSLKTTHGKAFLLLTLGFLFFLAGEITWVIFGEFLGIDPFPSIADVFYLLAYPSLFIGLLIEIKDAKLDFNKKKIGMLLFSFVALGVIFLNFTVLQQIESNLSFLDNLISALYGVGDIILVLMSLLLFLVIFEYRHGRIFRCWTWILFNFLAMLAADLIFAAFYEFYEVSILVTAVADILWMLSYGLFAIGMICSYSMLKEKRLEIKTKINK